MNKRHANPMSTQGMSRQSQLMTPRELRRRQERIDNSKLKRRM